MIRSSFVSFRGPAPLQHTILSGAEKTGVTLQTLDDKSFDRGIILAQTPLLSIPNWNHCTYKDLLEFISPKAASLLIQGLRGRVFIPPLVDVGLSTTERIYPQNYKFEKHATKITPGDGELLLLDCEADQIYRQYRAIGRLWSNVLVDPETSKRLIFEDITLVDKSEVISDWIQLCKGNYSRPGAANKEENIESPAVRFIVPSNVIGAREQPLLYVEDGDAIVFNTRTYAVRIGSITVEGQGKKAASKALRNIQREEVWRLICVPTLNEKHTPTLLIKPVQVGAIEKDNHGGHSDLNTQ
jgi:methionyl-tRNA formyltransferase